MEVDLQATIKRYDELWEVQDNAGNAVGDLQWGRVGDSGQDPEENPYKSKYVAREMLELAVSWRQVYLMGGHVEASMCDPQKQIDPQILLA